MSYILRPKFLNGFEVEWASSLGAQEPDNFDPDLIEYRHRDFEARRAAVQFAEGILPKSANGEARLIAYHLEEYEAGTGVYFKEYDGETEYFTK